MGYSFKWVRYLKWFSRGMHFGFCVFVSKPTFLEGFPYLVPSLTNTPFQAASLILYLRWQTTLFRHSVALGFTMANNPFQTFSCFWDLPWQRALGPDTVQVDTLMLNEYFFS